MIRRVEDLVVEDGEVERETKTDWVSRGEISAGNFGGVLVGFEGLVGRDLTLLAHGKLGQVAVVVSFPMREKEELVSGSRGTIFKSDIAYIL